MGIEPIRNDFHFRAGKFLTFLFPEGLSRKHRPRWERQGEIEGIHHNDKLICDG